VPPVNPEALSLGDVKSHLSEIVGRVHDHHKRATVTVHGKL
jgi:antitoxin YefM